MKLARSWPVVIVAIIGAGCQPANVTVDADGRTMGTTWTVRVSDCTLPDCSTALPALISRRLDELNAVFSHYDPASEVSAFNRHSGNDWFPVSDRLAEVVTLAQDVSELSNGAFDITVAAAVDAWGFGATATTEGAATDAAVAAAARVTGYRNLEVRNESPALRKTDPAMRIDLSAIAKGYAVDQLAYLLEREGMRDYLVEIGGELRVAGARPDGKPWRIGIEPPDNNGGARSLVEYIVEPGNQAVASSGDYRNFYTIDEQRISHTIDPATARPVTNGLAAVTVIAPSAAQADALATALMVLGPQQGLALAEQEGLAVMLTERSEAGLTVSRSNALAGFLLTY